MIYKVRQESEVFLCRLGFAGKHVHGSFETVSRVAEKRCPRSIGSDLAMSSMVNVICFEESGS